MQSPNTDPLTAAVAFAARAHEGQTCRSTDAPRIVHPMEVAAIAATMTSDHEILAAAMLHDVIESCGVTEDELIFTVADDGVGMPPEVVEQLLVAPAGKSGIGIKNVHERIQLTYGEQYGLKVESVEDEGTTVTIRLPRTKGGEAG